MASKLKHTSLQHFSEEKLIKWRKELQNVAKGVAIYRIDVVLPDNFSMVFYAGSQATSTGGQSVNVEQIFEEVFQAHNQQEQLKAIKKVTLINLCTLFLQCNTDFSSDQAFLTAAGIFW